MGETLLLALFDLNSMAFARGQSKMGETFNEHLAKGDTLRDGNWLKKVEAKVQTLPPDKAKDGAVLMDFLRKVMEFDPARRITAKDALQHEFLALKNAKVGKQKLRGVVPKAKGKPVTA
jgi:serine/threonine protein kinase